MWYEPKEALFSKRSGLFDIQVILERSFSVLKTEGKIFIEHAPFQAEKISELLKKIGYKGIIQKKDLNKDIRISVATK